MTARRVQGRPVFWRLGEPGPPQGAHVALAPGTELPLLQLDLPDKLTGIARDRVAQRMLAERLALPLDGLELRPWQRKGRPWTHAVVCDAARLSDWRGRLSPACTALLPDYMAVPCAPGIWAVEASGGLVRARLGVEDGFTAEPALAALQLEEAAEQEKPGAVLRLGDDAEGVDAALGALGVPIFQDEGALAKAGHSRPLRWAEAVQGLDLKAPPSAGFDRLRRRVRAWSAPVAAAVLALAIWLAGIWAETEALRDRATTARAEAEAMARTHILPSGPILDLRAQVTAALESAAAPAAPETDPLLLFQTAAPLLAGESVALQAVSYRADTGLVAAVELTDFGALEQLVADLRAAGFEVEQLDSGARQAGGVAARLRLEEARS